MDRRPAVGRVNKLSILQPIILFFCTLSCSFQTAYGSLSASRQSVDLVHVVLIVDKRTVKAAFTVIHSVSLASADPSRLRFHALVLPSEGFDAKLVLKTAPQCMQGSSNLEVKEWFAPSAFPKDIISGKVFDTEHIYARFFLPEFFPEIDRYVYIDNDVVVNGDIADLYSTQIDEKLSIKRRKTAEEQLAQERLQSPRRSIDKRQKEQDASSNLPPLERAAVGFVIERANFYRSYISWHFNFEHPAVKKAMEVWNVSNMLYCKSNVRCDVMLWCHAYVYLLTIRVRIFFSMGASHWSMQ
jgi:hypothetical protein